jgi:hypothetical protein
MIKLACLLLVEFAASTSSGFTEQLFRNAAAEYEQLSGPYADDLIWRNNPKQWHQQMARTVSHKFQTFDDFKSFARKAKQAGVSSLMLVGVNKIASCPGPWYSGLQLCDHINGSFPAADGTLEEWQQVLQEIKPMRLQWWWNPTYWSTQGEVWKEAEADPHGSVGRFFSWNATINDVCCGNNPCVSGNNSAHGRTNSSGPLCAQGSWGSDGQFTGIDSALASFGSKEYSAYLSDALANSWSKNLGIDGYCTDCSGNYGKSDHGMICPNGMRQIDETQGSLPYFAQIIDTVRATQPQVVMSGESYGSWAEIIESHADVGGQGFNDYNIKMQQAVFDGDASNLEDIASKSGADAASVVCYLNPAFDSKGPGACPTMYFRDLTATIQNLQQHQLWVALQAGSGIVAQHDVEVGHPYWNATIDPADPDRESPLWAFVKYRALNRLALRTKLNLTGAAGALAYLKHDAMGPFGDAAIIVYNPGKAGNVTIDLSLLPPSLLVTGIIPYDLLELKGEGEVQQEEEEEGMEADPEAGPDMAGYTYYAQKNCWAGHGGTDIDGAPVAVGLTDKQCVKRCTDDGACDCVTFYLSGGSGDNSTKPGSCWRRKDCKPADFESNDRFAVYAKNQIPGYTQYADANCWDGHGGTEIDTKNPVAMGVTAAQCTERCDATPGAPGAECSCVTYCRNCTGNAPGSCWRRANCDPALFEKYPATTAFSVYLKVRPTPAPVPPLPPMPPNPAPPPTPVPSLSASWTVAMASASVKVFAGFGLSVFAPRRGKKASCRADDQYSKKAAAATLQGCFLECLKDAKCENVLVDYVEIHYMEKPPPVSCTLLGAIKDPASGCVEGTGTLVRKLPGARSCAQDWQMAGAMPTPAPGAPPVPPGPPSPSCAKARTAVWGI